MPVPPVTLAGLTSAITAVLTNLLMSCWGALSTGGFGGPGAGAPGGARTRTYTYGAPGGSGFGSPGFGFDNAAAQSFDQEANINLSFSEAFHGTQKRLRIGNSQVEVRIPPRCQAEVSKIRLKGQGQVNPYSKTKV